MNSAKRFSGRLLLLLFSKYKFYLIGDFTMSNPHEHELRRIFSTARIEYGRIDYALLGERIQVWEINTNPGFLPLQGRKKFTGIRPRFLQLYRESLDPRHDLKLHFLRQYREALAAL